MTDVAGQGVVPFWLTAFIDFPAAEFEAGSRFWTKATGWQLSALRGRFEEFASLVPPEGADYLRVQRLGEGDTRLHLDVHVADPWEAAALAEGRGASVVTDSGHGLVVMRSPGGFEFCFTSQVRAVRPEPTAWPGGHASRVSQVCLDIPPDSYDGELAFWAATLGGEVRRSTLPEFARVELPDDFPFELLLQRLQLPRAMGGHLDLGSTDRAAEVARLEAAGARVRAVRDEWTVLEAPGGLTFCVIERDPRRPGRQE